MRQMLYIVLLAVTPLFGTCQFSVRGKVVDAETNKAIQGVSVYINNSFLGTSTDANGDFVLNNIPPGAFKLVLSHIGYETIVESLTSTDLKDQYIISLKVNADELKEVIVTTKPKSGWRKWGSFFLSSFIGTSKYASSCDILNKEALHFHFSEEDNLLKVSARGPIIIENRALGYKITMNLAGFSYNFNNRNLYYEFYSKFDYLQPEDNADLRRWRNNRKDVYYGSLTHFLRSLFDSSWRRQGFEVRKYGKPHNSEVDRIKDTLQKNTTLLQIITGTFDPKQKKPGVMLPPSDTVSYYKNVLLQYAASDKLFPEQLRFNQFAGRKDSNSIFLNFDSYLHVTYTKVKEPIEYAMVTGKYRPGQQMIRGRMNTQAVYQADDQVSTLQLYNKTPIRVFFNGNYNNTDMLLDGYWGWYQKVATLLPYDYKPD
jgi:hypothetical protein